MRRLAAHRIFISPHEVYNLHYVELDGRNFLQGIFLLEKEIAGTAFYNGTLFLSHFPEFPNERIWETNSLEPDKAICVFHSESSQCTPAEFGTNNGGSNSHIQRLC